MRYYIADLHFYHEALIDKMDKRGFADVEDMNEYMIRRWNDRVRKNDEVVIIGDFSFGGAVETNAILDRLKGRKYLITGNHDRFLRYRRMDETHFEWIKPYEEMHDEGRKVILCHYPILFYNGQYKLDSEGNPRTYMLYGHVHDTHDERLISEFEKQIRSTVVTSIQGDDRNIPCNMINCFCGYVDYEPKTLNEWIELTRMRRD